MARRRRKEIWGSREFPVYRSRGLNCTRIRPGHYWCDIPRLMHLGKCKIAKTTGRGLPWTAVQVSPRLIRLIEKWRRKPQYIGAFRTLNEAKDACRESLLAQRRR